MAIVILTGVEKVIVPWGKKTRAGYSNRESGSAWAKGFD